MLIIKKKLTETEEPKKKKKGKIIKPNILSILLITEMRILISAQAKNK